MADTLGLAADIVTAYVQRNPLADTGLPELIRSVYAALTLAANPPEMDKPQEPVVPIKKSVFDDHLVCLECGGEYKVLRRHLDAEHGLTTQQYRERFDLPRAYPLVSPNYAAIRSHLAKSYGLGRKAGQRIPKKRA